MKPYPAIRAPLRLTLALVLAVCGGNVLAQSAPAQKSVPATPPASAPAAPPAEQAKPAPPSNLQMAPAPEPIVGAGEHPDTPGTTANVTLPRVNVQGQRNVFNDNDKKLKDLQDNLPCAGCDATPHVKKKLVKRVLEAVGERVLPTEAPDHSDRDPNDKAAEFSQQNACNAGNVGGCVPDNLKP
ncbi:hypothetical protein [Nevskia soli]|uniref:hypothetical protein n=1 Tax=Nevskia soli TaxID=418856 RepID=UPI0004A6B9B8|nr:hypothetical protein [Nevskia soli]